MVSDETGHHRPPSTSFLYTFINRITSRDPQEVETVQSTPPARHYALPVILQSRSVPILPAKPDIPSLFVREGHLLFVSKATGL